MFPVTYERQVGNNMRRESMNSLPVSSRPQPSQRQLMMANTYLTNIQDLGGA